MKKQFMIQGHTAVSELFIDDYEVAKETVRILSCAEKYAILQEVNENGELSEIDVELWKWGRQIEVDDLETIKDLLQAHIDHDNYVKEKWETYKYKEI